MRIYLLILFFYSQFVLAQSTKSFLLVAHRGANKVAPENTMSSLLKAYEQGADMVEMDIRQTKDGEFVLMHDARVNRTTNGKGKIKKMTLDEVKKLDAGSWFSNEFKGEKVPTLREILRVAKGKGLVDLDIKKAHIPSLIKLLEEEGYMHDSVLVTLHSFNKKVIKEVQQLAPKIKVRPSYKYGFAKYNFKKKNPPQIVNIIWPKFSEEYVNKLHSHKIEAFINLLGNRENEANIKRAINSGAEYIQVNDPINFLIIKNQLETTNQIKR
ncbi:MAG: glycerophosphodiester phosphodiesterase [Bacteroidia bacterium]